MEQFELRTKGGYDFFQVASALQKCIRRGMEDDAMYWAVELYESNYANYVWKRLIIMASEDVGLGDPDTIVRLMALKQSYDFLTIKKEKSMPERLPFTNAVLLLVRSAKSRYVDHAITVWWHRNATERRVMHDWVFDMHTRKGKEMGRGLDFFYSESAKIYNANKVEGEEELEQMAMSIDRVFDVEREDVTTDGEMKRIMSKANKNKMPSLFDD